MATQIGGPEHNNEPIVLQPTSQSHSKNPSRKVSINSDKGHDNPGFEHGPRRKISANSDHSEAGPVRRKSILVNAHQHLHVPSLQHQHSNSDNVSVHSG